METTTLVAGVVLVVDDEPIVRDVFRRWLTRAGYTVIEASSGGEAVVRMTAGGRIDLLITDLTMPGMDGIQLTTHVREWWPRIPVIMVTGYSTYDVESGPDLVLEKPVRGNELIAAVQRLLAAGDPTVQPRVGLTDSLGPR